MHINIYIYRAEDRFGCGIDDDVTKCVLVEFRHGHSDYNWGCVVPLKIGPNNIAVVEW